MARSPRKHVDKGRFRVATAVLSQTRLDCNIFHTIRAGILKMSLKSWESPDSILSPSINNE